MRLPLLALCAVTLTVLSNALSASGQSFLTNGLISYYPFNGNANDMAGTNNGTPMGATLTSDRFGDSNSAYSFNGSSWIATPQYRLLDGSSNATISAWAVIDSGSRGQLLAAGDSRSGFDPISLILEPQVGSGTWFENCLLGNSVETTIGDNHVQHPLTNFTSNVWHQIVFVLSTNNPMGTFAIWVDGQLEFSQIGSDSGTTAFGGISYDLDMRFLIGAIDNSPSSTTPIEFWNGKIDDIRIYDRALSDAEIPQLYQYEAAPSMSIAEVGTSLRLDFTNLIIGASYQLQSSDDLVTWTNYGQTFTAATNNASQDMDVENGNAYFRLTGP